MDNTVSCKTKEKEEGRSCYDDTHRTRGTRTALHADVLPQRELTCKEGQSQRLIY